MDEISEIAIRCFDSSSSGIVLTSCIDDFPIVYCNDAFCLLTGYERTEVLGKNCRFLQGKDTDFTVKESISSAIKNSLSHRIVIKNYKKNGEYFWNDLYLNPILDAQGKATHYIGIQNDIKNFSRNNRNVPFHFPYDDLTQLPTPEMAIELLKMMPTYKDNNDCSIFLGAIIINGLANIRGFIDNSAADITILEVCARLQAKLDENYILARAGETEFIVASLTLDSSVTRGKLEELCISMLQPVQIEDKRFQLTYNAGFIDKLPKSLIDQSARLCNFALAQSLQQGRNTVVEFIRNDLNQAQADQILAGSIPLALSNGQLYVAYQPQVDLRSKKIIGFEALARWQHPDFGDISPGRFIPLCEQSGYIGKLTISFLIQLCQDLPAFRDVYGDVNISLNFSPFSLLDRKFVQDFIACANRHGAKRGEISIEVVENLSIDGYEAASDNLEALKSAGFKIILDDFGTGYSSLSYIRNLGASIVKIDREFVMNLTKCNADDLAIIRAVVTLSKQFNFEVIAEGIEDEEQAVILLQEGVTIGQGFLFSRPLRIDNFI